MLTIFHFLSIAKFILLCSFFKTSILDAYAFFLVKQKRDYQLIKSPRHIANNLNTVKTHVRHVPALSGSACLDSARPNADWLCWSRQLTGRVRRNAHLLSQRGFYHMTTCHGVMMMWKKEKRPSCIAAGTGVL